MGRIIYLSFCEKRAPQCGRIVPGVGACFSCVVSCFIVRATPEILKLCVVGSNDLSVLVLAMMDHDILMVVWEDVLICSSAFVETLLDFIVLGGRF